MDLFAVLSSWHVGRRRQHQPEEEVGVCSLQRLGADVAAERQPGRQLQDHHDRQWATNIRKHTHTHTHT